MCRKIDRTFDIVNLPLTDSSSFVSSISYVSSSIMSSSCSYISSTTFSPSPSSMIPYCSSSFDNSPSLGSMRGFCALTLLELLKLPPLLLVHNFSMCPIHFKKDLRRVGCFKCSLLRLFELTIIASLFSNTLTSSST